MKEQRVGAQQVEVIFDVLLTSLYSSSHPSLFPFSVRLWLDSRSWGPLSPAGRTPGLISNPCSPYTLSRSTRHWHSLIKCKPRAPHGFYLCVVPREPSLVYLYIRNECENIQTHGKLKGSVGRVYCIYICVYVWVCVCVRRRGKKLDRPWAFRAQVTRGCP